jgi:hypothetical protein
MAVVPGGAAIGALVTQRKPSVSPGPAGAACLVLHVAKHKVPVTAVSQRVFMASIHFCFTSPCGLGIAGLEFRTAFHDNLLSGGAANVSGNSRGEETAKSHPLWL